VRSGSSEHIPTAGGPAPVYHPGMSQSEFDRHYRTSDFASLGLGSVNYPILDLALAAATPSIPPREAVPIDGNRGAFVRWEGLPTEAELDAADAVIAAHAGTVTTSQPFVEVNNGPVTTTSSTPVSVIDLLTSPLDQGTYAIDFSSQFRMVTAVAGERAQAVSIVTVNGGTPRQQVSHSPLADLAAYNGSATINIQAGQTIRAQLLIAEIGGAAGTAEMSQARVTVDKVS
jgi:hypothetical protein